MDINRWMGESICHGCGKTFFRSPQWAYHRYVGSSKKYFCSYKCAIAHDKMVKEKKIKREYFSIKQK